MLFKKGTVVMLPTNEEPKKVRIDDEDIMTFTKGSLVFNSDIFPSIKMVQDGEIVNKEMGYRRAHLYLIVNEIIYQDDYVLIGDSVSKAQVDGDPDTSNLKVIASTDKELCLPKFSKRFLLRYVEKQDINEVSIALEEVTIPGEEADDIKIIPKVNKNGIISLKKIKDIFTIEEVKALFKSFVEEIIDSTEDELNTTLINEWINTNV